MNNIYLGHSKDLPRETSSKILLLPIPAQHPTAGATAVRLPGAEESPADSGEDTRPHLRSTGLTGKLFVELYQIKIAAILALLKIYIIFFI